MCWSLQKCLSEHFIKPRKKRYCFSVWIVTQRYRIVWKACETDTGAYTVSRHNPCLSLFVQQIMSFSTNKAFPTILLVSAGYVLCCVKSTVGSLNCINRTQWVVGYLHRRKLMICFTTAVLCWSPVEANTGTLLLCHCSLHFVHFNPQVVKKYIQQSILEKELLYFGYEAFGITFVDPVSEQSICCHYMMQRSQTYLTRAFLCVFYQGHLDSWGRYA